jgi:hypothetical protein
MHSLIVLLPGQGLYNGLMNPMTANQATKPYLAPHTALKIPPLAMNEDTQSTCNHPLHDIQLHGLLITHLTLWTIG